MVGLVLEEDAGDFVADELGRLVRVAAGHEEVGWQRARLDSQHQIPYHRPLALLILTKGWGGKPGVAGSITSGLHVRVLDHMPPHLDGVRRERVLGRRLLVLPVPALVQPLGPAVSVVPVEGAAEREVVAGPAVRKVLDQHLHPRLVRALVQPRGIEIADDSSRVDEVAVVEVMVVVVRIAEVRAGVTVAGGRDDAFPVVVVDERVLLLVLHEAVEFGFERG